MQKKGFFYGWWIVIATSVIHFLGAGIFFYGFTAFFNPLVQEFRWSYAATSLAASFRSLEGGIAAPIVGFLTDRFGPRKLILVGACWAGILCILMSRIDSLWSFYATFIFLSIGTSLMFPIPGWTSVTNWFLKKRGTAMGILLAAAGLSGILIPLLNWLIAQHGWRNTFVIAGIIILVICVPLSLVIRHHPEQYGYRPDGEEHLGKETKTEPEQTQSRFKEEIGGYSVRQAIKMPVFWILVLISTIAGAALHAIAVHIMPFLISVNLPSEVASAIAASFVLVSAVGRVGFGWLGDRVNKKYLLVSALLLEAAGLVILAYTTRISQAIVFLVLFGSGFGGVLTLRLAMQGEYFGRRAFGSIQGVMQGIHLIGTMLSPVFAGWVYDSRGSYELAWISLSIAIFLSIPLVTMLKPPKEKPPHV